jgi:maltooligosyltrehalose trehalohydrolase
MLGERLASLTDFEGAKLAAGMVLLAPCLPLLFMGEEYGETAPFLYFTSHTDEELVAAVRRGRREEFAAFQWEGEPPDPQSEQTFLASKLNRGLQDQEPHRTLLRFYQELIRLRKTVPALRELSKEHCEAVAGAGTKHMMVRRWSGDDEVAIAANFGDQPAAISWPALRGMWKLAIDSAARAWRGPGTDVPERFDAGSATQLNLRPRSFTLYRRH